MKILTSSQMKGVEQKCVNAGTPASVLMENAGRAVGEAVIRILGEGSKSVLVLVGPGNNGGDGLVAARHLHDEGYDTTVCLLAPRVAGDANLGLVRERRLEIIEAGEDYDIRLERTLSSVDAVIDAVFGTGKTRALTGDIAGVLGRLSEFKVQRPEMQIISVDLPSGMDADTGAVDASCPYADHTITLGFPKMGLFNLPGAERAGKITIVDIGIPPKLTDAGAPELMTNDWVRPRLPRRSAVANKGTFGRVMVVAGSHSYIGAAYLACSGAVRVGAGLVTLATSRSLQPILASKLTEVTYVLLPESLPARGKLGAAAVIRSSLEGYNVLLIGSGLGRDEMAVKTVKSLLLGRERTRLPCVIDADALNILSAVGRPEQVWRRLASDVILTPHPGEMSRLTGMTVGEIQSARLGVAQQMARAWRKTVVLKGAYTVVAAPDGRVAVSPFATPALASAGTGDVLAGAISGFLGQGMPCFEAAAVAVYVHGLAGEIVAREAGDAGVTASDALARLPFAIKELKGANRQGG